MASYRNAEHYADPTAYLAMRNIERSRQMSVKRGEIYYIDIPNPVGSEQAGARPGVIVSNEKNNESSNTVEVVYLTTAPKTELPTHATIRSTGKLSTAICEQISTVSTKRIGDYAGRVTPQEQEAIDRCMMISLDLSAPEKATDIPAETPNLRASTYYERGKIEAERDTYKALYTDLLCKVLAGARA